MGTSKLTLSVVPEIPEITVTFVAAVVAEGPPPEVVGSSVTVTLAGWIAPLGKPWPVTVTTVTTGSAALGEADAFRVTFVTAPGRSAPESNTNAHTLSIRKVVMVGLTLQAAQCRISENRRPHLIICVQSAEGKGYCYYR